MKFKEWSSYTGWRRLFLQVMLTMDGMVVYQVSKGSITREDFLEFLEEFVVSNALLCLYC